MECRAGYGDWARGDASVTAVFESRFRVFAGLRDDPFFNNVKGTRAAYNTAVAALKAGAALDAAGCPAFGRATSDAILDQWRHTDGGPAKNFLAGWTPASIAISIDLDVVAKGGPLLAVWATTSDDSRQIDRMEAAGWIERRPDTDDRRAVCLYVTDKAEPTLKALKATADEMRAVLTKGISKSDLETTANVLAAMRENAIAAGGE